MSSRFTDGLNAAVTEIEAPPRAPAGTYVFGAKKVDFGSVAQGRYDTVDIVLGALAPQDDVDTDALAEAGGVKAITLRKRFMFISEDSDEAEVNRKRTWSDLRNFLENHLGMDTEDLSMKEALEGCKGLQCLGTVGHRPDPQNPERIYVEITSTAPILDD